MKKLQKILLRFISFLRNLSYEERISIFRNYLLILCFQAILGNIVDLVMMQKEITKLEEERRKSEEDKKFFESLRFPSSSLGTVSCNRTITYVATGNF